MSFPNELGVGRINRILQRLLQIKGGAPTPVLTPEVLATIVLEMDRLEYDFLHAGTPAGTRQSVAASVANFSGVQIRNPTNSGVLAVVEYVQTNPAANFGLIGTGVAGAIGTVVSNARDSRFRSQTGGLASGSLLVETYQVAAPLINFLGEVTSGNFHPPRGIAVVGPGASFCVQGVVVNSAIDVGIGWRERAIEDSEK